MALIPPQATAAGAHENTLHALNQKNIVRCHVTDQNGDALIGVTVMPVSGKGGTVSDIDGNFTIDLPKDGKVTLSYAGYKSLTIKLKEGMRETWGRIPRDAWRISPITVREEKKAWFSLVISLRMSIFAPD